MNTHACKHVFVRKRWSSGYIHKLLYGARQGVEIWPYSCIIGWTQVKYSWMYYSGTPLKRTPFNSRHHDTADNFENPHTSILKQP